MNECKPLATGYPEVRFWCLQTLAAACRTRLPSLTDADAAALKGAGGAQHLSSVSLHPAKQLQLLSRFVPETTAREEEAMSVYMCTTADPSTSDAQVER